MLVIIKDDVIYFSQPHPTIMVILIVVNCEINRNEKEKKKKLPSNKIRNKTKL